MVKLKEEIEKGKKAEFQIRDDDMIVKGQRMCVPEYGELKRDIMEEAATWEPEVQMRRQYPQLFSD